MKSNQNSIHLWLPNIFEFKGGIQVYLQDVLRALEIELPDRNFLVLDKLDQAKPQPEFNSARFSFLYSGKFSGIWQTIHFTLNTIKATLTNRPQLILCGHLNFAPVAWLINRFTNLSYWIIVYGVDAWEVKSKWKIKALHEASKIISISDYTRSRLVEEQNLSPDKIPLLPVTFDASRFQIAAKPDRLLQRYNLIPEQPVILTVARLAEAKRHKGYDQILKALPEIRQTIPNVHYIIVGKGSDRPRIEKLIAELDLKDCVTLAGFIPDAELNDHYNLCDVFAMPSKGEGFGIVYLEALACGKPTLGGDRDGARDALCQGELGVLVNPDDIGAIAQNLIQILQGTHPHPLIYQPEILRQKVIDTFGFAQFQKTLKKLMKDYLNEVN
ncbi:MAG: glycosyltransferase [Pleurocapsa sp.]